MRKAKVVAIVCGILASCLIGGFAVVEAATITLDDSSATEPAVEMAESAEEPTEAATETSLETTAPVRESIAEETTAAATEEPTEPETAAETEPTETEASAEVIEAPAAQVKKAAVKAEKTVTETETAAEETEATAETVDLSNVTASDEIYIEDGNIVVDPVSYDMPAVQESVVEEESDSSWTYSISERDYILLCNAVGHEAGAN